MGISTLDLNSVKSWIRIDTDEDDELLKVIMAAAKRYLIDQTGLDEEKVCNNEVLAIAYLLLCSYMYDERSISVNNDKKNAIVQDAIRMYAENYL